MSLKFSQLIGKTIITMKSALFHKTTNREDLGDHPPCQVQHTCGSRATTGSCAVIVLPVVAGNSIPSSASHNGPLVVKYRTYQILPPGCNTSYNAPWWSHITYCPLVVTHHILPPSGHTYITPCPLVVKYRTHNMLPLLVTHHTLPLGGHTSHTLPLVVTHHTLPPGGHTYNTPDGP